MTAPLLLLVDDAFEMGLIVRRLGTRAGCAVEHRPDAASARAFLEERLPDLILLDVNLPGTSGPEFCRGMRAEPRTVDVPVAVFTHEGLDDDIAAALDAGADFFFSKDLVLSPEQWAERLGEILGAVRGRGSARMLRSHSAEAPRSVPEDWVGVLNGALRSVARGGLAPPVARALLRRALKQVFVPSDADHWLSADGFSLDAARAPALPERAVSDLASALAGQIGCFLGAAAGDSFRVAVAGSAEVPESPTRQ